MIMRQYKIATIVVWAMAILVASVVCAQDSAMEQSLAERLGYSRDAKLLIVHADDVGFSHSANSATSQAFESGAVQTGAIMVPTPWFPEIAAFVQEHPQHDFGVHITLTSEWKYFKWDGVLPADQISSLLAEDGYFYGNGDAVTEHADAGEAEREARAQIDRAIAFGIDPTHLDVHNMALWGTPELFEAYLRIGRDYKLPILMSADGIAEVLPEYQSLLNPEDIVLDRVIMMARDVSVDRWETEYAKLFSNIEPGVTQLIIHFGFDDAELRAMTVDRPNPDAAWRQSDFNFFTSTKFQDLLRENSIQLVTWREIRGLLR